MNCCIQQKRMNTAIPGYVDKPDKLPVGIRAYIQKAVIQFGLKILPDMTGPRNVKQVVERLIGYGRADPISNITNNLIFNHRK